MSTTMKQYQQLEARIRKSDLDAQETRWEFGRKLLGERGDKKRLPDGLGPLLPVTDTTGRPIDFSDVEGLSEDQSFGRQQRLRAQVDGKLMSVLFREGAPNHFRINRR